VSMISERCKQMLLIFRGFGPCSATIEPLQDCDASRKCFHKSQSAVYTHVSSRCALAVRGATLFPQLSMFRLLAWNHHPSFHRKPRADAVTHSVRVAYVIWSIPSRVPSNQKPAGGCNSLQMHNGLGKTCLVAVRRGAGCSFVSHHCRGLSCHCRAGPFVKIHLYRAHLMSPLHGIVSCSRCFTPLYPYRFCFGSGVHQKGATHGMTAVYSMLGNCSFTTWQDRLNLGPRSICERIQKNHLPN
jgi:hypothetical protein